MTRRLLSLVLLLVVGTACPHTWGREGYVQRMLHENAVKNALAQSSCPLSEQEWRKACGAAVDHSGTCPKGCPLPKDFEEESEEDW